LGLLIGGISIAVPVCVWYFACQHGKTWHWYIQSRRIISIYLCCELFSHVCTGEPHKKGCVIFVCAWVGTYKSHTGQFIVDFCVCR
jgi:hypothetical protein